MPDLENLLRDSDLRVRSAALEALPKLTKYTDRDWLLAAMSEAATTSDLLVRETLAEVAVRWNDARLVPALKSAFADSKGLDFAEARKLLLHAIGTLDKGEARAFLRDALSDPDLVVRREACVQLAALGETVPANQPGRQAGLVTPKLGDEIPLAFLESRPRITLTTTRGDVEITLRPDQAPIHAWNLVQLVTRGVYDNRIFHRVVPNFVVQGGDHRGDGSGACAWHGKQIRDEINPLLFDAGTVGMPKTADPDTGGDQIFITTVPTPHLDGRYTAFGTVTRGMDVVELIEIGDLIMRAVVAID